jgi:hypothetical protein
MVDLPDALEELRNPDLGAIAEIHELLGANHFRDFVAEVTDALETKSHPVGLGKRVDVVIERIPAPEIEGPKARG